MSKILKYFIIGLAIYALLSTIITLRSCHVSNKSSRLEGQFQAYKEETEKEKERLVEEKEVLESEGLKKDNEILALKEEVSKSNLKRIRYEKDERENIQEIKRLKEEAKGLTNKDFIIANLQEQVSVLEDSNRNKDIMLFEADKQIKNLTEALYISEEGRAEERAYRIKLEEQLAREERNGKIQEDIIKQQKKDMRGMKLKITAGNVVITGLAAVGGYLFGRR